MYRTVMKPKRRNNPNSFKIMPSNLSNGFVYAYNSSGIYICKVQILENGEQYLEPIKSIKPLDKDLPGTPLVINNDSILSNQSQSQSQNETQENIFPPQLQQNNSTNNILNTNNINRRNETNIISPSTRRLQNVQSLPLPSLQRYNKPQLQHTQSSSNVNTSLTLSFSQSQSQSQSQSKSQSLNRNNKNKMDMSSWMKRKFAQYTSPENTTGLHIIDDSYEEEEEDNTNMNYVDDDYDDDDNFIFNENYQETNEITTEKKNENENEIIEETKTDSSCNSSNKTDINTNNDNYIMYQQILDSDGEDINPNYTEN